MFTCATLVAAAAAGRVRLDDSFAIQHPNSTAATSEHANCQRAEKFKTLFKLKCIREGKALYLNFLLNKLRFRI